MNNAGTLLAESWRPAGTRPLVRTSPRIQRQLLPKKKPCVVILAVHNLMIWSSVKWLMAVLRCSAFTRPSRSVRHVNVAFCGVRAYRAAALHYYRTNSLPLTDRTRSTTYTEKPTTHRNCHPRCSALSDLSPLKSALLCDLIKARLGSHRRSSGGVKAFFI